LIVDSYTATKRLLLLKTKPVQRLET